MNQRRLVVTSNLKLSLNENLTVIVLLPQSDSFFH